MEGFENKGENQDSQLENRFEEVTNAVLAARREVEAMGGVDALKKAISRASNGTKEHLELLFKGSPAMLVIFTALGIVPSEIGALLGQASNPEPFTGSYLEAAKFGLEMSGVLGAFMATVTAGVGAAGTAKNFFENLRLIALKRKAKV